MSDDQIEVEKPFTYKRPSYSSQPVYKVYFEAEERALGSVRQETGGRNKDKWGIYELGATSLDDRLGKPNTSVVFETREQAAKALFVIRRSIEKNPLSDSMRYWFQCKSNELRDRRKELIGQIYGVQREMYALQKIAEENNLNYDFGVDVKQEVADLKEFMNEYDKSFYENQGKDFARSLKARVASVVRLIDPEIAGDIW